MKRQSLPPEPPRLSEEDSALLVAAICAALDRLYPPPAAKQLAAETAQRSRLLRHDQAPTED